MSKIKVATVQTLWSCLVCVSRHLTVWKMRVGEVFKSVTPSLFPLESVWYVLCFYYVSWNGLGLAVSLGLSPNPNTLMSSGRLVSTRFSWSFLWMDSSVASTLGFITLSTTSCFFSSSFSSWDPKLLGSVLLRCRILGVRSSSDIFSLDSSQKDLGVEIYENWRLQNPNCFSMMLIIT